MTDELSAHTFEEELAIAMAIGNNGGKWASHYTNEQKDVWRKRAAELMHMFTRLKTEDAP